MNSRLISKLADTDESCARRVLLITPRQIPGARNSGRCTEGGQTDAGGSAKVRSCVGEADRSGWQLLFQLSVDRVELVRSDRRFIYRNELLPQHLPHLCVQNVSVYETHTTLFRSNSRNGQK